MQEILLEAIRDISEDQIFDACGTIGGAILAGALLPQIYRVAKRRRAGDVSYAYQVRRKSATTTRGAALTHARIQQHQYRRRGDHGPHAMPVDLLPRARDDALSRSGASR